MMGPAVVGAVLVFGIVQSLILLTIKPWTRRCAELIDGASTHGAVEFSVYPRIHAAFHDILLIPHVSSRAVRLVLGGIGLHS